MADVGGRMEWFYCDEPPPRIKLQIDAMNRQAEVAKRWQLFVVALGVIQTVAAITSIVQIIVQYS
jgi:hypothetical protein